MTLEKEDNGCVFIQFKTEEQAQNYYDLRAEIRLEGSAVKLAIYNDVVLIADSNEVVGILKLNFH